MTYAERRDAVIQDHFNRPHPGMTGCTDHRGYLNYATAALWLIQDVTDANAQLAAVRLSHITGTNCGPLDEARANLWLGLLVQPYGLFASDSRHYPGRMTPLATNNLVEQMWSYARRFSAVSRADGPWTVYDSENHDVCAKSFNLLAAQMLKRRFPDRIYSDGTKPGVQYAKWCDHWNAWFDERAKRGSPVEVSSPTYMGYTLRAIFNIYSFAEDEVLRKKAEMTLDIYFADYALQRLAHVRGGAKCRSYPIDSYDGRGDGEFSFGMLLFGPEIPARTSHILSAATSGYEPPELVRVLADPVARGAFEYVSRKPGVGPDGWDNTDWHVDSARSVVNYAWVTPDFVMGCAMLNPQNTHIGPSNQNRWQGVQFATGGDARVYPQAAPTSVDKVKDAFDSVQKTNTLITRKRGYGQYPTLVCFPASLDVLDEEAGWVFVKEGNTYLAVRPAIGTYAWLDAAKNMAVDINKRFIQLSMPASPIIFEATRVGGFPLADFKREIIANERSYANGLLGYTSRSGARFEFGPGVATVNDTPVSYAPTTTYKSPYLNSGWNTGLIVLQRGTSRVVWDFRNESAPVKTVTG